MFSYIFFFFVIIRIVDALPEHLAGNYASGQGWLFVKLTFSCNCASWRSHPRYGECLQWRGWRASIVLLLVPHGAYLTVAVKLYRYFLLFIHLLFHCLVVLLFFLQLHVVVCIVEHPIHHLLLLCQNYILKYLLRYYYPICILSYKLQFQYFING